MKTFTKLLSLLLSILLLVNFSFANTKGKSNIGNYQAIENIKTVGNYNSGVPAAVLDPNFREWQPPRPVPVIPANINDIMMTDGSRIYYNPMVVSQNPRKIVAFFLAHEYGHVYGSASEFYADQFAARVYAQTDISVVKAAIWHFHNVQGMMCNATHGCGWQRAVNIGQTAGFSQAQIQEIIRGNF